MNDDLTKLEHMLRDRAAEIPHVQEARPKMLARARRRVVRNGLTTVLAVGLIVAGASAGLGALRGPSDGGPAVTPTVHSPTPAPSTRACTAADLGAKAALGGAAGSVVGFVDLTNLSASTCTLTGRPVLTITNSAGQSVPVSVNAVEPQWQVNGASPPHGWPVVRLQPRSVAEIRVAWANACPQLAGPARWNIGLKGGDATVQEVGSVVSSPPPCNGPSQPSDLQVGPFEPGTK
jgi:Protein of unknown function (DUF4232)